MSACNIVGPTFRPVTPCHSPKRAQIKTQHAASACDADVIVLLVKAPTRHPARSMCGSVLVLRVPAVQLTHHLEFLRGSAKAHSMAGQQLRDRVRVLTTGTL